MLKSWVHDLSVSLMINRRQLHYNVMYFSEIFEFFSSLTSCSFTVVVGIVNKKTSLDRVTQYMIKTVTEVKI